MSEVGLLPFARVALEVATAVLPPYRSCISKHQFTQPQLLAVWCLMRYEDWTFRETEVRLREHRELRRVLGLRSVPDYTTLCRFFKRLDEKTINQALGEAARRLGVAAAAHRQALGTPSSTPPPYFTLLHCCSVNTLSRARPQPSLHLRIPCCSNLLVKASLLNWGP